MDTWIGWGVPEEKCVVVKPGDSVKIKDIEIVALEAFDRTALVTASEGEVLRGKMPQDMDLIAVNYLFKTSGGNLYHAGDSHYCNYFAKHGNDHQVDVCLGAFGEKPTWNHRQGHFSGHAENGGIFERKSSHPSPL